MGIDPGVSIGTAVRFPDGRYMTATYKTPGPVWDMLRDYRPEAVCTEAYHTNDRVGKFAIHTIELVGSIRGICHVLGIAHYGQMPQARKSFVPDAKQLFKKIHGRAPEMTKDQDDHEISALSHLLCLEWRLAEASKGAKQ